MKSKLPEMLFFPFLIALYPVFNLFSENLGEMSWVTVYRSVLVSLMITLALLMILRLSTGNLRMAAVLSTFILVLFFSYGHVYSLLKNQSVLGMDYGRHRFLGMLWIILGLTGSWLIIKRIQFSRSSTMAFNLFGILLVALPIFRIINYSIIINETTTTASAGTERFSVLTIPEGILPDIYYLVLDRYSRDDLILSHLGYDNSEFIQDLENRGFYIARCSRSNYYITLPSIASTLNMVYLDELSDGQAWLSDNNKLIPYIHDNTVRRQLEAIGYHSISLTAYQNVQWPDADIFIDPKTSAASSASLARFSGLIAPFEAILLRTTILRIVFDLQTRSINELMGGINYPYARHVQEQLFILDKIPELPYLSSPNLAYIHVSLPHPPYVFGPDGELVNVQTVEEGFARSQDNGETPVGYVNQLQYLNKRILEIVDKLVSASDQTPIIIIQGDHGFSGDDADAILNAYLVPDAVRKQLYDTITPVNSFRVIFSTIFNGNYPLLPDYSYLPGDEGQLPELSSSSPVPCSVK